MGICEHCKKVATCFELLDGLFLCDDCMGNIIIGIDHIANFTICRTNWYMNTVEANQIMKQYLKEQERQKQLQLMQLRKNLNTFTLKQLKKKIEKMKADTFAVTRMKRDQIIELIIAYHYLFPHLKGLNVTPQ